MGDNAISKYPFTTTLLSPLDVKPKCPGLSFSFPQRLAFNSSLMGRFLFSFFFCQMFLFDLHCKKLNIRPYWYWFISVDVWMSAVSSGK